MEKPQVIVELESELDFESKQIDFNRIDNVAGAKLFAYSTDNEGNIVGLILKGFGLWLPPKQILNFSLLRYLNLRNNTLVRLDFLKVFKELEVLDLSINQIDEIHGLQELHKLERIDFSTNFIEKLEGVAHLERLEYIKLSENFIRKIENLAGLSNLEILNLSFNRIVKIENLYNLKSLWVLSLEGNDIDSTQGLERLPKLRYLYLRSCKISEIKGIDSLGLLFRLELQDNKIKTLSDVNFPDQIRSLLLSHNDFRDLSGLDSIIPNLNEITLDNNPLISTDYEDLILVDPKKKTPLNPEKQQEVVSNWLKKNQSKTNKRVPIELPIKVLLLGNSEVGKTCLQQFLVNRTMSKLKKQCESHESTHMVEVTKWAIVVGKEKLEVQIWDFGGQDYYHSLHHLFFTSNSVYLVLYDATANENKPNAKLNHYDFNLTYWLANIENILRSKSNDEDLNEHATVLIENKIDKNGEVVNIPKRFRTKETCRVSLCSDKMNGLEKAFNKERLNNLKQTILHQVKRTKKNGEFVTFESFQKVIGALTDGTFAQKKTTPRKFFISKTEFIKTCQRISKKGISDEEYDDLIRILESRGLIITYYVDDINDMGVWLFPDTLVSEIHDRFSKKDLFEKNKGQLIPKQVEFLEEDHLLTLLEHQEIVFVDNIENRKKYIFPQFLPSRNEHEDEVLFKIAKTNLKPCFSLRFKYFLPSAFMSRLICRFGKKSGNKYYQRYELVYTDRLNELDENDIRVWIKTDMSQLKIDVYIGEVQSNKEREEYLAYLFKELMITAFSSNEHIDFIDYSAMLHNTRELGFFDKIKGVFMDDKGNEKGEYNIGLEGIEGIPRLPENWQRINAIVPEDLYIQIGDYEVGYYALNGLRKGGVMEEEREANNTEENMAFGRFTNARYLPAGENVIHAIHKTKFNPFLMNTVQPPIKIFVSYAHRDYNYLERIETHLSSLRNDGIIEDWNDTKFQIGDRWDEKIKEKLNDADIYILLISADFINSSYIQQEELKIIKMRNDQQKCRILPVIVEDCDWEHQPYLKEIQAYPFLIKGEEGKKDDLKERKPAVPIQEFPYPSKAYKQIVKMIRNHAKDKR